MFHAPANVPEQFYINYQWNDVNGDVFDELLKLTSGSTNADAPVFDNISPIEIDAEGLFTRIDALSPSAVDIMGNPVSVAIDGTPRIRSGNQVVYWIAKDDQGRESIAGQLFKVNPQVNIEQKRIAYEGEKSILTIRLNGLAPDYPVNIPLNIVQEASSSDGNDHGLSPTMILSIEKGRTASMEFDVYADDVIEGTENVVVNLDLSVNKGYMTPFRLT
ncbi:fibronectin type III domain protein [Vibrio ponticus]|nr:fibronectin type III domain protein [Vibrio ponticus]